MPCLLFYRGGAEPAIICINSCCAVRWTFEPGDTGSTLLFYARVTDIVLGVIVVLIFDLIFPWCDNPALWCSRPASIEEGPHHC